MGEPTVPPPPPVPVHGQRLEYAYLVRRRPAIVTAIGVMSVLVGLASLLASGAGLTVAGAAYNVKQHIQNMPPPAPPAPPTPVMTAATRPTTMPTTAPATAPTALSAADVQVVLTAVQSHVTDTPLTPQQRATLQALLEEPNQDLAFPSSAAIPASNYVAGLDVDENATAHVVFMNVIVSISQQGQVVAKQPTSAIPRNIAGAISNTAMGLAIVESIASGALALFLIVAGVLTLRQPLGGRRLHWLYVAIKVPLAILAIFAWAWLAYGLNKGMNTLALLAASPGPETFIGVFWLVALVLGTGGLAYPVALVFALRSRAANEYYNMITR